MQPADIHPHSAAEIGIGAKVFPLLALWHGVGFDAEAGLQPLRFARQLVIITPREGAAEAADHLKIAIDIFLGKEAVEIFSRKLAFGMNGIGVGWAEFLRELSTAGPPT